MSSHRIRGRLVARESGDGVAGIRVEAWDADKSLTSLFGRSPRTADDRLGEDVTDAAGNFVIVVDDAAFADFAAEGDADVYFRLFGSEELLDDTREAVDWGATAGQVEVRLDEGSGTLTFRVEGLADPLAPPRDLTADGGDGTVDLSWSDVEGADSYTIYWATAAGVTPATGTPITGVSPPFTHEGLTNGTTYHYVVVSVGAAGTSAPSTEVLATPAVGDDLVGPPVDPTTPSTVADSTAFLYTGQNPVQRDVEPETIDEARAAVLRGRVTDETGAPLSGVGITVAERPEFGRTETRAGGLFDMVVNGGTRLVVRYTREGYLTVQRRLNVPQRDFVWAPEVTMTPAGGSPTTVDLESENASVVRGTPVSDADGQRRATVVFPAGTTAMIRTEEGVQVPTSIRVRAVEYTVGERGPSAMPGELPPTSGYTYAVELTAESDAAVRADAEEPPRPFMSLPPGDVQFDQPVITYVENFLGFPVGTPVPVGYYDRESGSWIASDDGLVVEVLNTTAGLASLDLDGSGTAADDDALAALGVDEDERRLVAELYEPGQSLWRAPIPHFTPWDLNWPPGLPDGAVPPDGSVEDVLNESTIEQIIENCSQSGG